MPQLEIVRAGAGSGKTTDLCDTVASAVAAGLDPSRILATTFTKKAAAELKSRIQSRLLAGTAGNAATSHRQADRLELAAIGTVHSVALHLLKRYSIPLGLSPRLRVLTEVASDRALSDLLGTMQIDAWQAITATADRLGNTDLRPLILQLVAAKRGNRISDDQFRDHVRDSANRVCELLAPQGVDANAEPASRLVELLEQSLRNIDALTTDTQQNTQKARNILRFLKSRGGSLWGDYVQASKVEAGKRSGADAMLNELRNHAAQVRLNPRLHSDVREFSSLLAEETIRLGTQYETYKRERGLVDFTDLEILLLELLENSDLAGSVAADYDLILVDEFQDTNPLQLAIFQRLRGLAPRSRWVGDPKQAIYGFRDTDPELVNEVWRAPGADRTELPNNHRSQGGLVQIIGQLFAPVFGNEAIQQPQNPGEPRGVERWLLNTRNQPDDAKATACGIAKLREEGIRFGSIAVLERTHRGLETLAEAFDALGIPYLLGSPGLLSTREGVAVLAGLRLVADRNDALAAATILHIFGDPAEVTPTWLAERLQEVRAQHAVAEAAGETKVAAYSAWAGDPRFAAIEKIDRQTLSPLLIAQQVVEALGLPSLVAKWGDPARRCANIDSLLKHASEYESVASEVGEATTVNGLILYFERLADDNQDMRHPPLGHDAVTLMTYHGAKGLEWPVVVLCGLNSTRPPEMWSPAVTGGKSDQGDPLEGRLLRAWTWPFGYSDGPFGGPITGSRLEVDALACPEGQERTLRTQNESVRLLYVGCTRAKTKLVLVHRPGQHEWLSRLAQIDTILPCSDGEGEIPLSGVDTTLVVRHLDADMVAACTFPRTAVERWLLHAQPAAAEPMQARFHYPSGVQAADIRDDGAMQEMGGDSHFLAGLKDEQTGAIGNSIHRYLAALPSLSALDGPGREAVAARCLAGAGVTGILPPATVVSVGARLIEWVETNYPGANWATEVPITGPRADGGQWIGTIDLVLTLANGELVILDHKSAPIRREQAAAKASEYFGQLAAYREVLLAAGESVAAALVHFSLTGVVVRVPD